jgi:hypothetical protein
MIYGQFEGFHLTLFGIIVQHFSQNAKLQIYDTRIFQNFHHKTIESHFCILTYLIISKNLIWIIEFQLNTFVCNTTFSQILFFSYLKQNRFISEILSFLKKIKLTKEQKKLP